MIEDEYKIQVDDDIRYGPKRDRHCTDVLFCIVFIVFSVVNLYVVVHSFKIGDMTKIARPYDYDGK